MRKLSSENNKPGITDLCPKWVKSAPNGGQIKYGSFQIRFRYILSWLTCGDAHQQHTDQARPGVVRSLQLLPASLHAFLHYVSGSHAVAGDVSQPVDGVDYIWNTC